MNKQERIAAFKRALWDVIMDHKNDPVLREFEIISSSMVGSAGPIRLGCGRRAEVVFDIDVTCIDDSDRQQATPHQGGESGES